MKDIDSSKTISSNDIEIDLFELFRVLLGGKLVIIAITSFFSIVGVIYSLSLPNVYESKAILVSSQSSKEPGIFQSYSSLANLTGIEMISDSKTNETQAIEKLNSLSFFENHFLPNIFLPDLMGFESWDPYTKDLTYDSEVFDIKNNSWVRNFSYPQEQKPTAQESFIIFQNKHFFIEKDKKTNFIYIKMIHQSPYIAQEWIKILIDQINNFYRKKDRDAAEKASDYLNNILNQTNLSEIKEVVAELLKQETQKLTLIEANESYVFEYIDPPAVMETKFGPRRSFICIVFFMLGFVTSVIYVFVRHYFLTKKEP